MINENEAEYTYVNDYLIAYENGKVGIIDYDGQIVYPIEYMKVTFSSQSNVEIM